MIAAPPFHQLRRRGPLAAAGATLVLLLVRLPLAAQPRSTSGLFADRGDVQRAALEEIVKAMRLEQEKGYDLSVTSNGARLLTGVVLELVRWHGERDADQRQILIDHRDYFAAYVEVTRTAAEEAPVFLRVAHEHGEDQLLDYRRDRVVDGVKEGPEPLLAVNVEAGWRNGPKSYSYEDKTNKPHLKVTHKRRNSYRILDFGDFQLYDDIRGVTGRATSGPLGFLFDLIGEAQAVQSRGALSEDGLQITRTTAKKFGIRITQTATVHPDGRVDKGLPPDRPDLVAIEKLLKQPLAVDYRPLE